MKTSRILTLTIAILFFFVGSVMAAAFNDRPITLGSSGEPSLQAIFDDLNLGLNSYSDQSEAAIWKESENDVSSYLVTFFRGDSGNLGIYSTLDTTLTHTFSLVNGYKTGFDIVGNDFLADDGTVINNFGTSFGFFWHNTDSGLYSYTEDDRNSGGSALALSYLLEDGQKADFENADLDYAYTGKKLVANAGVSTGDNDWILAFEDTLNGDGDFNDAVFWIEDMQPVPEPATMVLLGLGLIGLGTFGRKKGLFAKKA